MSSPSSLTASSSATVKTAGFVSVSVANSPYPLAILTKESIWMRAQSEHPLQWGQDLHRAILSQNCVMDSSCFSLGFGFRLVRVFVKV